MLDNKLHKNYNMHSKGADTEFELIALITFYEIARK